MGYRPLSLLAEQNVVDERLFDPVSRCHSIDLLAYDASTELQSLFDHKTRLF